MSMSKKDFIALADAIKEHNRIAANRLAHNMPDYEGMIPFVGEQLDTIATFCQQANSNFMRDRWLAYIAGECGPNGGALATVHTTALPNTVRPSSKSN